MRKLFKNIGGLGIEYLMEHYRILGVLGAVIAYPFIAISIVLTPWFNFYSNALSDLGNIARNAPVAYVFNFGLILSGFLVALFALLTSLKHRSWKYLSWSVLLIVAGIDLALIGVFSEDAGRLHGLVSIVFFILIIIVMLAYSFCSWVLGTPVAGVFALVFSIASATVWTVEWGWDGVAIQETVTSLMTAIWLVMVSMQKFDKIKPVETEV
ncbi:MAG: DUF998 domain-containing protein [Thermoproteota archaeon]